MMMIRMRGFLVHQLVVVVVVIVVVVAARGKERRGRRVRREGLGDGRGGIGGRRGTPIDRQGDGGWMWARVGGGMGHRRTDETPTTTVTGTTAVVQPVAVKVRHEGRILQNHVKDEIWAEEGIRGGRWKRIDSG